MRWVSRVDIKRSVVLIIRQLSLDCVLLIPWLGREGASWEDKPWLSGPGYHKECGVHCVCVDELQKKKRKAESKTIENKRSPEC
jgi:hypothetical protein